MSEKKQCIAKVCNRGDVWHRPQCKKIASIGDYCKTHDPETKRAKRQASYDRWKAQHEAECAARSKATRIHAAEQKVIRVAKDWLQNGCSAHFDLVRAIRALEQEEQS